MSQQQSTRKQAGTVEASEALRLEQEKVEQIVDALNADLANVYVLYHQLRKHHWNVEGAEFRDLHLFLGEAAEEAEAAADELAERVQALGGVPHASAATLESEATVEPEDEDVYDIRTSLANDVDVYGEIIESARSHIELTEGLGDHASAQMLREQLVELEDAVHHIEHYLEDDTLVTESAMQ
ncbi:DNA starvation/stationary phase protection protein DpsA [Halomicrobium katesii]|uniref:DNA starvation/stationary phase protection protein DpsA n=1 Tax=Halomicrobium katesii TaxID=437163 RepID=UPI00035E0A33|nr:DNA starvation/stationary phase protection protein DpsA [Halomicrobium katesii]